MSIPGAKSLSNNLTRSRIFSNNSQQPNTSSNSNSENLSPQIVSSKSGKVLKPEMGRYSMNIEENVDHALDSESDFTRSHTLTDINQMGLQDQSTGSQSTLASESSRTSAVKLLHSSNNPHNFSNQNIHRDSAGSPIWKPRHNIMSPATNAKSRTQPHSTEQTLYTGSAYGNYASIVFDDKNSAVLLTPPNAALFDYDDTEC